MRLVLSIILLPLWLYCETLSIYDVPKMHCPLCTVAVKKSLKRLEGVNKVEVRLNTKAAKIWHDDTLEDAAIKKAVAATGYEAVFVSRTLLDK